MAQKQQAIKAIRGMNDLLPHETAAWQHLEHQVARVMQRFGYHEIRMPIVESLHLFARGVGEGTDIVEKEMYAFEDRNQDWLCLRPEGTASCVRAGIEHGLFYNQTAKLWYLGPMYRHERPQKGRYRQFYQWGVETFGFDSPLVEVELAMMAYSFFKQLGVLDHLTLEVNTLGNIESRQRFQKELVLFLNDHFDQLDSDSQRRLKQNPLRILDSKNPQMQALLEQAPKLEDYLDEESQVFFKAFCQGLESLDIAYQISPHLVRGLDYYNHVVFEWTTDALGAQGTVCAGGRYDSLVESLGGPATPACGFAMGLERVLLLMETLELKQSNQAVPHIILLSANLEAHLANLHWANTIRQSLPDLNIEWLGKVSSLKSQFKKADKSGAALALIVGEDELAKDVVTIKFLRENKPQAVVEAQNLIPFLTQYFT